MITISTWLFVIFIVLSSPTVLLILAAFIYFITGLHDLHVANKVARGDYDKCPDFIDKETKK